MRKATDLKDLESWISIHSEIQTKWGTHHDEECLSFSNFPVGFLTKEIETSITCITKNLLKPCFVTTQVHLQDLCCLLPRG